MMNTKINFSALPHLTNDQKAEISSIDMTCADLNGQRNLSGLFENCKNLRELDLSMLNPNGVFEMRRMFKDCQSLQRLDLSGFNFRGVFYMDEMFSGCDNLQEVILSDTIYKAGRVHIGDNPYTPEELSEIWRSEYISSGPQLADIRTKNLTKGIYAPIGEVSEQQMRRYLGLKNSTKITIVPHRTMEK